MNYIRRIQAENAELVERIAKADKAIGDVIAFLHSPKFTGQESDGGRKDWIATGDMIAILQSMRSTL